MSNQIELSLPELDELNTPEKRLKGLRDCLQLTATAQRRAAAIFAAMEACGDDVRQVSRSTQKKLRAIRKGELLPEVFTELRPDLISVAQTMPVAVQRAMIEDLPCELVLSSGDVLNLPPSKMTRQQCRQVFATGYVRDLAEQRAYIEDRNMIAIRKQPDAPEGPRIDRKKRGVWVGNQFFTVGDIGDWLRALG